MRLNEFSRPSDIEEAQTILLKHGWQVAGRGYFGTVFKKQGRDRVLKLFAANDAAFIDFVKLAKTRPNPHFPKFGKMIKVNEHYVAVQMEELDVNENGDWMNIRAWLAVHSPDNDTLAPDDIIEDWMDGQPDLKKACFLILSLLNNPKYALDIKRNNFMSRNSTIVFTDPICIG